jgi:hypothetical protein
MARTNIGILALLVASLLGACTTSAGSPPPAPAGSVGVMPSASGPPSEIAGLQVISVATAAELLQSGKLNGEAVAVSGYFEEFTPPCPYPGRSIGPLESWCRLVAFTDSQAAARLCSSGGSTGVVGPSPIESLSCAAPSGTNLAPFFMTETSGNPWSSLPDSPTGEPNAMVLIGHAGDARQWQCTEVVQAQCASAFVVDRIAWAAGQVLPPALPDPSGPTTRMTLGQVATVVGLGDELLTAVPLRATDVAAIDPRWNLAGDHLVWFVRSLGPAAQAGSPGTRPETVWLVDDATGKVIDSHALKVAAGYQPARLWRVATMHGLNCCSSDVTAFYRVMSSAGTAMFEGPVPGDESSDQNSATQGGGFNAVPLDLPAGGYTITSWLASNTGGVMGPPRNECSTQITLRPLETVALDADFPAGKACTFRPATLPSPGD